MSNCCIPKNCTRLIPELLRVQDFQDLIGLSRSQIYDLIAKMPAGVVVRLNRRIRLNSVKLIEWLDRGGTAQRVS